MGGSASRSTVTPYRNVQYSVLSTGADLGSIKGMLPTLENKLDNLETENQAQAQKAVLELKSILSTTKEIPEDTLARIERLVFDFSHFVNNQGEERLQQGKTKSRIKHGVGKTVIAGMVGFALGIIYSSFGDQDFNQNESQGVAVITGTAVASSIAMNEIFTQYAIYSSESRQLILAEEKAIHDFEVGILGVTKELQDHSKEKAQQAFEQQYSKLILQLETVESFLKMLTKLDKGEKSGLMSNEFKATRRALENRTGVLSGNLEALERTLAIYSEPNDFKSRFSWMLANCTIIDEVLSPLARAADSSMDTITELLKHEESYNTAYKSSLYQPSSRLQVR